MKELIIGMLFISTTVFGQELQFDIHNTSLAEYLKLEEQLGNERIHNTSRYYSGRGIAQPIRFQRKEENIPDCIVSYQFYEKDSIITQVEYEWDVYNFEKQENNKKSEEFENALIAKYKELKNNISTEFGQPETKSNYSNLASYRQESFFEENSNWKPNDSTGIELYITSSNHYEKRGASTINPTHRIRLYIRKNKKEELPIPKLDNEKLSELETIKKAFFKTLKARDLKKSKYFLSDLLVDKVTDEQINILIDNINFEKETELIHSGVQMGFDGSMYTILQYKYSDDSSSPPNQMIKLIFDDKDKVLGIQPIQYQEILTD